MRMPFRVGVLAGFLALTAAVVDWKALKTHGYVSDFAHVIRSSSRAQIETYAGAAPEVLWRALMAAAQIIGGTIAHSKPRRSTPEPESAMLCVGLVIGGVLLARLLGRRGAGGFDSGDSEAELAASANACDRSAGILYGGDLHSD